MSNWEDPLGQTLEHTGGIMYIPCGLGTPQVNPVGPGRCGWCEGCLGCFAELAATTIRTRLKIDR